MQAERRDRNDEKGSTASKQRPNGNEDECDTGRRRASGGFADVECPSDVKGENDADGYERERHRASYKRNARPLVVANKPVQQAKRNGDWERVPKPERIPDPLDRGNEEQRNDQDADSSELGNLTGWGAVLHSNR